MTCVLLTLAALGGCRDEINLPEYEENIDGDGPTVAIVSPAESGEYHGSTTVPIAITFRDNFFLSRVTIEIAPQDSLNQDFVFTQNTNDSSFTYTGTYTLPIADTTTYAVILTATDSVENEILKSYLFKASQ